jgi:hypothetical protein
MRGPRELGTARVDDGEEVGLDGLDVRAARTGDHHCERAEALVAPLEGV